MKTPLAPLIVLFVSGCLTQPPASRIEVLNDATSETARHSWSVLSDPPDEMLDEMASKYSSDKKQWRNEWKQDTSSTPMDGQRALTLLEIACYADVMCHPVEYRLRDATLDYIRENLESLDVRNSLVWIRTSYKSRLPLVSPGDENEDFKGALVEGMKIRLTEYANSLLGTPELEKGPRLRSAL